jgi:glucokinase
MQTIHHLAIGLCNIINILSPELIILSGGITKANMDLFDPLHTFMDKYEWKPGGQKTPIVKAQFVPFAGAAGAAGFAMQKLNVST